MHGFGSLAPTSTANVGSAYLSGRRRWAAGLTLGTAAVLVAGAQVTGLNLDFVLLSYAAASQWKRARKAERGSGWLVWNGEETGSRLKEYDPRVNNIKCAYKMARKDAFLSHLVLGLPTFLWSLAPDPDNYHRKTDERLQPHQRCRDYLRPEAKYSLKQIGSLAA